MLPRFFYWKTELILITGIHQGPLIPALKPRFTDIRLIPTPHYYGQFALSLEKQSAYIFFNFNPLSSDTFYGPSVSVLTEFDSTCFLSTEVQLVNI